MFKFLNRTIWLLSLVSLFADMASEMLYPIMPKFLELIGFTALGIGALEGASELVAGFGKAYFGSLSDQLQRRNIFVRFGYGLSGIAKPLMGIFPFAWPVFAARLGDRVGKGMRGAARDALLTSASSEADRGKVFGFHRSMDTLGAVFGPTLALLWLSFGNGDLKVLFILAIFPGLISLLFTFFLPKENTTEKRNAKIHPFKGIFGFWKESSRDYRKLLLAAIIFAIVNSSDMLLLLKASESGASIATIVGLYITYNMVYVITGFPLGGLADKIGFKPVYILSIIVFGICYASIGFIGESWALWGIFGLYGIFSAANEGIAKAWLSKMVPKDKKATGMGLFSFLETIAKALASPITGILWLIFSGDQAFSILGIAAIMLSIAFIFLLPQNDVMS